MTSTTRVHPFEVAGLGHAPYRFVGFSREVFRAHPDAPTQPGTTCDFCGQGIMDAFHVHSADGKHFKVGCDCVRRVWQSFDATIPADFRQQIAAVEREKREAKRVAKFERVQARVAAAQEIFAAHPWMFTEQPHPNAHFASKGKTYRDYVTFLLTSGGISGRESACRIIEKANV